MVSSHYSLYIEDPIAWDEGLMSILKGISSNGIFWRSSEVQGTGDLPFARKKPLEPSGSHCQKALIDISENWQLFTGGHSTCPEMGSLHWRCLTCLLMLTFLHVVSIGPFPIPLVLGGIRVPRSHPISPPYQEERWGHDYLHFSCQSIIVAWTPSASFPQKWFLVIFKAYFGNYKDWICFFLSILTLIIPIFFKCHWLTRRRVMYNGVQNRKAQRLILQDISSS